nr:putative RNA-dependent RNA polymerase [Dichroa partitivirus 2]
MVYEFTRYRSELERLPVTHPHVVRRESAVTYRDEFALEQLLDLNPELYPQFLEGWSRSYYLPEKHLQAIMNYSSRDIPMSQIQAQVYQDSVLEVKNRLRSLPSVRAFDIVSELDQVSYRASSAAGYDYLGAKGEKYGQNHLRAISRAKVIMWSVLEDGDTGMNHAITTMVPDVGYTRTQLADLSEKTKIRSVWGRAFHYILLEGVVADPLLKAFSNTDTFYHIGQDPTESVPRLLSEVARDCKWIYALDWKQFDASVSNFEINTAFDIIKEKVTFPNKETETAFEISRQLFIHKKIAAPDGNVYWAHKGIPSGSYFTSIIGSIINRIRIEYLWRLITGHGPKMCFTQGDDSLVGDDILLRLDIIAERANQIGWYFNPDKTEYSTVPEMVSFLGRTYVGGINTRDLKKCLRLLIFPEYPVDNGRISAFRAKSISEDAGNLSEILNKIALRLKRHYGVASEQEVPLYFKTYVPGM